MEIRDALLTVLSNGMEVCSRNGKRVYASNKSGFFTILHFEERTHDLVGEEDFTSLDEAADAFLLASANKSKS